MRKLASSEGKRTWLPWSLPTAICLTYGWWSRLGSSWDAATDESGDNPCGALDARRVLKFRRFFGAMKATSKYLLGFERFNIMVNDDPVGLRDIVVFRDFLLF